MATLADYPDDWEEIFLSNPNFSMVEYSRKMDEYQRLLKARQDTDDASGMSGGSEGAGVRSDQIYDSADPATRKAVGWGGGAFSPTEMSTGEPEEVAPRYAQWGNEVDMGNRRWGIAFNKALPNVVNFIPGYNVVKSINDSINKNKNQTAAASTTTTTPGILDVVSTTSDETTSPTGVVYPGNPNKIGTGGYKAQTGLTNLGSTLGVGYGAARDALNTGTMMSPMQSMSAWDALLGTQDVPYNPTLPSGITTFQSASKPTIDIAGLLGLFGPEGLGGQGESEIDIQADIDAAGDWGVVG